MARMPEKINLGLSRCLLGERVRYDGGHKQDRFLTDTLGSYVRYVPVCPEVECGFSTPREPFRLVGDPASPRLVTIRTGADHTDALLAWARKRIVELEEDDLDGFIFKSNSPSSGMANVKVYDEEGVPHGRGIGIFARVFLEHFPLIPIEDDGRLHDPRIRENFIERVFTLRRWRQALREMSREALVEFHIRHELLLLSHSPKHVRTMGKLIARSDELPLKEFCATYQQALLDALRLYATPKNHASVLRYILGYLKKSLTSEEKQEVLELVGHYQEGHLPLIVPVTLLSHHVRKYDQPYLRAQFYLNPHPIELCLRNHV